MVLKLGDFAINVESPLSGSYPTKKEQHRFVASYPVKSARYFDRCLRTFFSLLAGSDPTGNSVGLFGRIHAHYGALECQGRRSLHVHFLLWSYEQPTQEQLLAALESDTTRGAFTGLIDSIVHHGFVDGPFGPEEISSSMDTRAQDMDMDESLES